MTSELDRSKEKKHSPTDLQDQLRPSIGGIDNLGLKQRDIVDDLNNMLAHIFIESMEISQNDKTLKSNCANYQEVNSHCLLNRSIAHDLNNLLAHLNLSAELLREALP